MHANPSLSQPATASLKELVSLMKPGVMALVVFTGLVGLVVAPGNVHPFLQLLAIGCIALASGAGAMINMWYDRDIDAIMTRTQKRPLPAGKVHADDVIIIAVTFAVLAVGMMGLATNWLAAGILAFAIFFYSVVYTMWLKRSTPQNIVIGGAAGAFPPMIGWVAMTGHLSIEACILFAIIFLWTPPHFWALALYKNDDYQRANIPMMPVCHGLEHTKSLMIIYCWALFAICLCPILVGLAGPIYSVAAISLNILFLMHAYRVKNTQDMLPAKKMFGYSILFLFLLFSSLMADSLLHGFYAGISM